MLGGEIALVTGAGRARGRQIALDLARPGAPLGPVSRSADQLDSLVAEVAAFGGTAFTAPADVTDRAAFKRAIGKGSKTLSPLTIAVSNAAPDKTFGPVGAVDPDVCRKKLEMHVLAAYTLMHAVIPRTRRSGRCYPPTGERQ
jgi:NAD(P)-dependent dehydrogenase (short-subunit alcohol dehydrogenase family)